MAVVLGISPGRRTTAFVVISGTSLSDMEVWETKADSTTIVHRIKQAIEKYQVQAIAMKIVASQHCTEHLYTLYDGIRHVAHDTGIFLSEFETETLRQQIPGHHTNKQSMLEYVVSLFPELELPYHTKTESQQKRFIRVVEALACAWVLNVGE